VTLLCTGRKAGEDRTLRVEPGSNSRLQSGRKHKTHKTHKTHPSSTAVPAADSGDLPWERRQYSVDQVQEQMYSLECDVPSAEYLALAGRHHDHTHDQQQQQQKEQQQQPFDTLVLGYGYGESDAVDGQGAGSGEGGAHVRPQLHLAPADHGYEGASSSTKKARGAS
jgi:hypothetical protein